MKKLDFNPVLRWIKNRIESNKNVIMVINGPTGSAKTYCGITLAAQCAEMFKTNFTVKENIDFNFAGLLKKTMLPHNKKPGTPFLFEEAGSFDSGAASRGWQSQANQFFFSFMQTTRHRRQILIFTCPHFSFLEKGARSLVHLQAETAGIDFAKRVAFLKVYRVQVNSRTGQFYFKYLRVKHKDRRFKFKRLEVPHPPDDMAAEYEKIKTKFTSDMNKKIIEAEEQKKEKAKIRERGTKIDLKKLKDLRGKKLSQSEMARILKVSPKTVYNHLRKMRESANKGNIANDNTFNLV